jgi:cyclopropane fatty-acyl-phospholipid synthase-like methyltransferase
MDSVPKEMFASMYAGQAPWDIGKPQPAFIAIADRVCGSVLDAGCGTGDHSIFFAARGCTATGIDFLEEAIRRAKKKAEGRGLPVTFLVMDALDLKGWGERFDTALDCGLFHVFSDADRLRYVEGLSAAVKPGGKLFLMCFSDEEPGTMGPRRVTKNELNDAFRHGWIVESIEPARFEIVPIKDMTFSEGGPKAWFAVIRRA